MAEMDHYENGKWVGSTKIEGHSNTTGWVDTYSTDGKVRSTMIRNTNTFDYKPEQHPPKSIEQIQNERAGKEALDRFFGKIYKPLLIISVIGGGIYIAILLGIGIKEVGLKELFSSLIGIAVELVGGYGEFVGFIFLSIITVLFYYILFRPAKGKKKSNKKKK